MPVYSTRPTDAERLLLRGVQYLTLLLLLATGSPVLSAQSGNTVTISGTSFTAPDTLLLLKAYEDLRYQGQRIPVQPDSTFHFSFTVDTLEQYELVSLREVAGGAWRPVAFFPDTADIRFELLDLQNRRGSLIEGSRYTDRFYQFTQATEQKWMPIFGSEMGKARDLPAVQAQYKQDSLLREMLIWQFAALREYPTEIELALFYDAVSNHQDNDLVQDVFREEYARIEVEAAHQPLLSVIENILETSNNKLLNQPYVDFYLLRPQADSSLLSEQIPSNRFTIVDLWSPWCGPCIRKSRTLAENYDGLRDKGIEVVSIVGGIDSVEKFNDALARFAYPWKVYSEISDHQNLWSRYGFENSGGGQVLISRDGVVKAVNPTLEEIAQIAGH